MTKRRINKWKITTFVLILLLGVVGSVFGTVILKFKTGGTAGENVIEFINSNLLQGQGSATLEDVSSESGVYRVSLSVQGQPVEVYVTKDGELMFIQAVSLTTPIIEQQQQVVQQQEVVQEDPGL